MKNTDTPTMDYNSIISRIKSGDTGAEASLYNFFKRRLLYYVRKKLSQFPRRLDLLDVEDICHDAWLAVIQNLRNGVLGDPNLLSSYIYKVFSNKTVDLIKECAKMKAIDLSEIETTYTSTMSLVEISPKQRDLFNKTWRILKPRDREIFRLRYFQELNCEQIAKLLEITQGLCRQRIRRAKNRLLKVFSQD